MTSCDEAHSFALMHKISAVCLCCWCLTCSVFSRQLEYISFWWIVTTGTTVRFQTFMTPPRQKQSASKIFTFSFASRCMQPNIWTPPWAKCMNLTSKDRADTEAHQDDLATDRTSSKHLAPTLLQSLVLYLKRALPDRDGNVEGGCGDGKRHGSGLSRSQKDYFSKCAKSHGDNGNTGFS